MKRGILTMALMAILFAFCISCSELDSDPNPSPNTSVGQMTAALMAFDDCQELESYLKEVAINEVEKMFTSGWGAYPRPDSGGTTIGVDGGSMTPGSADVGSASADTAASPAPSEPGSGDQKNEESGAYSGTNNQVEGVEEADIIKTDGLYLYILRGRKLHILKAEPAAETAEIGTLEIQGQPIELLIRQDRALVFSRLWGWDGDGQQLPTELQQSNSTITKLTLIDMSDRTAPAVKREIFLEADYVSSRMVDAMVHIVSRAQWRVQLEGPIYYGGGSIPGGRPTTSADVVAPGEVVVSVDAGSTSNDEDVTSGGGVDAPPPPPEPDQPGCPNVCEAICAGEPEPEIPENCPIPSCVCGDDMPVPEECKCDAGPCGCEDDPGGEWESPSLEEQKQEIMDYIQSVSLDDVMPIYVDIVHGDEGSTSVGYLAACSSFYRPSVQLGLDILSVFSLNLDDLFGPTFGTAVLGSAETVYGSPGALYIASYPYDYWFYGDLAPEEMVEKSLVHKFGLTEAGAVYQASGMVDGRILNQFSMDEFDGHLRLATTIRDWMSGQSSNTVTVLGHQEASLVVVGEITGIAVDEQIYSVRFMGPRGFVVTFRTMDPLFTLDLSDPTDPKVVGELKIPGFSTYMHPLGDNHLLTIGRDTVDNGQWVSTGGVQLSIFDVSDFANPTLTHKTVLGSSDAQSEAEYNHKAFTFFAQQGWLAIPLQTWGTCEYSEWGEEYCEYEPEFGLALFTIDPEAGIGQIGFISHRVFLDQGSDEPSYYYRTANVRGLFIGEFVYSISELGVLVNGMPSLGQVASVTFPWEEEWCGYYGDCGYTEPTPVEPPVGEDDMP